MPKGVTWIRDTVVEIDPDAGRVRTAGGRTIGYDYLVVAPGIQYDWDAVKGLRETLGKNGVVSIYTFETAEKTWEATKNFQGSTAVFTNPLSQVKCGGVPQKVMYLADDYWRCAGVRGKTEMIGAFAGTVMLGGARDQPEPRADRAAARHRDALLPQPGRGAYEPREGSRLQRARPQDGRDHPSGSDPLRLPARDPADEGARLRGGKPAGGARRAASGLRRRGHPSSTSITPTSSPSATPPPCPPPRPARRCASRRRNW